MTHQSRPLGQYLARVLRHSVLSDDEQAGVLSLPGTLREVAPRRALVHPGDKTTTSCLVVEGLMARFDQMRDGKQQTVAFHIPGDMCDLQSVVAPVTGWGLESLTRSVVFEISHAHLRALGETYPAVTMAFWRDTVVDGSVLAKWAANVGSRPSAKAVAHLFCELGVRMEFVGRGRRGNYPLPISQLQLAEAAAISPVHANRTLGALRSEGVTFSNQAVVIADWEQLADFAEFDPAYLLLPHFDPHLAIGGQGPEQAGVGWTGSWRIE